MGQKGLSGAISDKPSSFSAIPDRRGLYLQDQLAIFIATEQA